MLVGMESMSGCPMGFVNCDGRNKPCPLHSSWVQVKNHLEQTMATVTIRDLQLLELSNQHGAPWFRSPEQLRSGHGVVIARMAK